MTEPHTLVVISDWHLLQKNAGAPWLRRFLDTVETDLLVCNGDMLDGQRKNLHRPRDMDEEQKCVLDSLNARVAGGLKTVFLPGNHDEELRPMDIFSRAHWGIRFEREMDWRAPGGKLYKITHGDRFEPEVWHIYDVAKKLGKDVLRPLDNAHMEVSSACARIDMALYDTLKIRFNAYAAYSTAVEELKGFRQTFEDRAVAFGRENGYGGIITGHTHVPYIKTMPDGFAFINAGDGVQTFRAAGFTREGRPGLINIPRALLPDSRALKQYNKAAFRDVTEEQVARIHEIWPGRITQRAAPHL
jgi:UDP-2,3-diacylglucosamine pyrophosphatase LpxH